jgi:DNA-binding transcriptional ArsR family regulator
MPVTDDSDRSGEEPSTQGETLALGEAMAALLPKAAIAVELLKAISHEQRLIVLCMLVDGEKSVTELEALLGARQPALSQQLARLRADGLVATRRDGRNVFYSLAREDARAILETLYRVFCKTS